MRALMVYLNNQQLLPFERISQLFEDIYGRKVSPATITKAYMSVFDSLEIFVEYLKAFLIASSILHFDETVIQCRKKTHWVHVSNSPAATFHQAHKVHGSEGMFAGRVICSNQQSPTAFTIAPDSGCTRSSMPTYLAKNEEEQIDCFFFTSFDNDGILVFL